MEQKSNFLAALSLIGNGSWFLVEENQKHVVFLLTVLVTLFAIVSYINSNRTKKAQRELAESQKAYYDKKINADEKESD